MARETVQVEVVKCDGCGRKIDPAADPNFGNHMHQPGADWKHYGMVNSNGLTLVCYAMKEGESPYGKDAQYVDCCEHCFRELVKRMGELV